MAKVTLTVELSKEELTGGAVLQARGVALASVANAGSVNKAPCEPTNFTPTGGTFVFDLTPPAADPGAADPGSSDSSASASASEPAAAAT